MTNPANAQSSSPTTTSGVRCLKVLLAGGVDVALVVTHQDSATENIWFESVLSLCETEGIPFITPDDAKGADLLAPSRPRNRT
jgi:methionyl-tRNA formyltransferase